MSAGLVVLVFFVIVAGAVIACWASYREGQFNGYLKGYDDGWKAERQTVGHQLNRALYQAVERGLVTYATIDRLYERTQKQIRHLDPDARSSAGGERP
jgi:hypothetical protein